MKQQIILEYLNCDEGEQDNETILKINTILEEQKRANLISKSLYLHVKGGWLRSKFRSSYRVFQKKHSKDLILNLWSAFFGTPCTLNSICRGSDRHHRGEHLQTEWSNRIFVNNIKKKIKFRKNDLLFPLVRLKKEEEHHVSNNRNSLRFPMNTVLLQ